MFPLIFQALILVPHQRHYHDRTTSFVECQEQEALPCTQPSTTDPSVICHSIWTPNYYWFTYPIDPTNIRQHLLTRICLFLYPLAFVFVTQEYCAQEGYRSKSSRVRKPGKQSTTQRVLVRFLLRMLLDPTYDPS